MAHRRGRSDRSSRYQLNGDASDPYVRMLGGEFIQHGKQQVARVRVPSPGFPGFGGLGESFQRHEEWYSMKDFAPDLHVLLVLETAGMEGGDYQRPPFPVAWARRHGEGRVAFNAMGHREDVWLEAPFQQMLTGMLRWAAGLEDAPVEPNLATVTPEADVLPPEPPAK